MGRLNFRQVSIIKKNKEVSAFDIAKLATPSKTGRKRGLPSKGVKEVTVSAAIMGDKVVDTSVEHGSSADLAIIKERVHALVFTDTDNTDPGPSVDKGKVTVFVAESRLCFLDKLGTVEDSTIRDPEVVCAMITYMSFPKDQKLLQQENRNDLGIGVFRCLAEPAQGKKLAALKDSLQEQTSDLNEAKARTQVIINAWAIGRDPSLWEEPEEFRPERFLNSCIDFKGFHFKLIPFRGAGRRGCPGILFAIIVEELAFANLLYKFNFALPSGERAEEFDMTETTGIVVHWKSPIVVIATPYFL
ncbi:hypothetical protein LguiA_026469 [Lonicera macranthoides]